LSPNQARRLLGKHGAPKLKDEAELKEEDWQVHK